LGELTRVGFYALIPFTGKNWKTNMTVKSPDSNGNGEVFRGKIQIQKKILFVINLDFTFFDSNVSVSNVTPWDMYPGGYYGLQTVDPKVPADVSINELPVAEVN
jgi:hypothetical protein